MRWVILVVGYEFQKIEIEVFLLSHTNHELFVFFRFHVYEIGFCLASYSLAV